MSRRLLAPQRTFRCDSLSRLSRRTIVRTNQMPSAISRICVLTNMPSVHEKKPVRARPQHSMTGSCAGHEQRQCSTRLRPFLLARYRAASQRLNISSSHSFLRNCATPMLTVFLPTLGKDWFPIFFRSFSASLTAPLSFVSGQRLSWPRS